MYYKALGKKKKKTNRIAITSDFIKKKKQASAKTWTNNISKDYRVICFELNIRLHVDTKTLYSETKKNSPHQYLLNEPKALEKMRTEERNGLDFFPFTFCFYSLFAFFFCVLFSISQVSK